MLIALISLMLVWLMSVPLSAIPFLALAWVSAACVFLCFVVSHELVVMFLNPEWKARFDRMTKPKPTVRDALHFLLSWPLLLCVWCYAAIKGLTVLQLELETVPDPRKRTFVGEGESADVRIEEFGCSHLFVNGKAVDIYVRELTPEEAEVEALMALDRVSTANDLPV